MKDRWAVLLQGEQVDISDAQTAFVTGPLRVENIVLLDGSHAPALLADELEAALDMKEARGIGTRLVDWVNGALFVRQTDRVRLTLAGVATRHDTGKWSRHIIFAVDTLHIRIRENATVQRFGPDGQSLTPPQPHRRWFELAAMDDAVADVLMFLSRELDWFDLYKAFEVMRDDLNKGVGAANQASIGWPDTNHFQRSAQVHRHGLKSKHAGYTLQMAMSLSDARTLVHGLAEKWLAWRVGRMP